jgi:hypothetical protein
MDNNYTPTKGMLNPLWFLDSLFPDIFENNKQIISITIVNKLIISSLKNPKIKSN